MGRKKVAPGRIEKDPLWYKNAIIYEVHVRAFYDSNGDGVGDFPGLTQKLDYLQSLGITAIWLLPFYPSPLKDDGYDTADYYSINPLYGTLQDFKKFLHEAHARGLRVITELVLNHTSDQHPWFQRARREKPTSPLRQFYVWSESQEKYKRARIIFKDFEPSNWTWDAIAKAYYWHRFYYHQPDLNYDNPKLHAEMLKVLDYWLDMGVDGVRLDAVPYLYEREDTSCENLPETHQYLKSLRKHVDQKYGDRMLLGEANQWPEDAVSYLGSGRGDECHMAFHFPLMPRLFMAVRMEDRVPIVDILEQTPPIPETSQWALFLRNHDELTLEMVTDEERDYMYRVYASDVKARINLGIRRRLAPLLGNDRKRIELLNLLLLSFPGTPVIYYGDEIGMGDNVFLGDRNGVRTPMQWSADRNAGFSHASPQALYLPVSFDPEFHYESINVDTQERNPHSLLWWTKRVLALRKRWRAFGRGTLEFLHPDNRKILAFVRRYENETILVVANLSRFTQPLELDLSPFKGTFPLELFGRTEFPAIGERPYFLTLSPHAAFWFSLEPASARAFAATSGTACHALTVPKSWEDLFAGKTRITLEHCLPAFLQERRWFGGKGREIKSAQIREDISIPIDSTKVHLALLTVEYLQGDPDFYLLPLAFANGHVGDRLLQEEPQLALARVRVEAQKAEGVLYDAVGSRDFCQAMFESMVRRRSLKGIEGELLASSSRSLRPARDQAVARFETTVLKADQSNTSILFGGKYILKLFRRLDIGTNPDLEIGRFLTSRQFPHVPAVVGAIEYQRANGDMLTLGILSEYVPDAKDAWSFTLDALSRFFDRVRTAPVEGAANLIASRSLLELAEKDAPAGASALLGAYLESARLLGKRTAELHLALASDLENKEFAPEPFTPFYQRSLYQSMRNQTVNSFHLLRRRVKSLNEPARLFAERVLQAQNQILKQFRAVYDTPMSAMRIRTHGDFHLGQVLSTGKDFFIIDFEGEPARPLSERRIKRSPVRDVAGMIRSFHYAAYAAFQQQRERGDFQQDWPNGIEQWLSFWYRSISAAFIRAYLAGIHGTSLLPHSRQELGVLLNAYLLDKALYEVSYELNNRPAWVGIPLLGILHLIEAGKVS
jgi:maltose alpha-D-glucosyltransferase/alpha-amylase